MAEAARIYERDDEVASRLRSLGLEQTVLSAAILFAEAERRTCTENDPGILKGVLGWGRGVRSLREQLRPGGWHKEEPQGLPLVVSPDRRIAITIATGDDQTGNRKAAFACTRHHKGPTLREWVQPDQPQISIFDADPTAPAAERPELWILLVGRTETEVRAELSRPTSVALDARIRFGGERIILKPLAIDQTLPIENEHEDDEPGDDVSVERI